MNGVLSQFQIRRTDKATRDEVEDPGRSWVLVNCESSSTKTNSQKIASAGKKKKKKSKVPGYFDYWQIANLIDYHQVYATTEKPKWRQDLEQRFGPIGIRKPGYMDVSEVHLWEWDEAELGELTFDSEQTLTFDGSYFYVKKANRAGRPAKFSIALESWLEDRLLERDPNILLDKKWRHKNLWHEFIRVTQVRIEATVTFSRKTVSIIAFCFKISLLSWFYLNTLLE